MCEKQDEIEIQQYAFSLQLKIHFHVESSVTQPLLNVSCSRYHWTRGLLPLCKGESKQSDSTPDEARMTSIPVAPGGRTRILSTGNRRTGIIPEYPRTCVL
ncbi:hypothetical protein CDAR_595861 [Caerostris darwini]|uniref:Uncharacterized protein n=1 Tax=Caerostris darwini TaxID=1538125 RepID=A0AAV4Q7Q4_9ARAC|nr:hypothetical protein CDAR_595861 [Caerostris darwini]